jgi:cytochrome c-type biogenesis protein
MFTQSVSVSAAFVAGLLSFFSPCVLPLIPAYFTFISGFSLDELVAGQSSAVRRKVVFSTLMFVLGFSLVFILMGASASLMGVMIHKFKGIIRIGGGLVIILLGLHLLGFLRIPILEAERRVRVNRKPIHFLGILLIGMAFGAGWSPCVGPLLGAILIMAGSQETVGQGMGLLSVYSLGLAIPFMAISLFINLMLVILAKIKVVTRYLNPLAGGLLILLGLALLTDRLNIITGY